MAGKVYVFNCYNEPVALAVNGSPAGTIPPWGNMGASTYQPQSIALGRAKSTGSSGPQFGPGNNACRAQWESFSFMLSIVVPSPRSGVSLDDDLVLYLFVTESGLATTRG